MRPSDAFQQQGQRRADPDREAAGADQRSGLAVHEGAAAGGEHDPGAIQQAADDPALHVAEGGLAEALEDFANAASRRGLDLLVRIDEGQAERLGQAAADGGLAGPHQAHEHDAAAPQVSGQVGSQVGAPRSPGELLRFITPQARALSGWPYNGKRALALYLTEQLYQPHVAARLRSG